MARLPGLPYRTVKLEAESIYKRLFGALILLFIIVTIGTIGFILIEDLSLLDSLYMTLITISTVGFREVAPLSSSGKIFTIFLIVAGIGNVGYALGTMVDFLVEGHLIGILGRRKMSKKINTLNNHFILCGYGRVGRMVASEFNENNKSFVVIDNNPEVIEQCELDNNLCIFGDASQSEVLSEARAKKARGLIVAVDSDADNLFVTLSARQLNPNLFIVSRALEEETREKLLKAGANRVVIPTEIGGRRMATMLMKPFVSEFLDVVTTTEEIEYRLEEFNIKPNSKIIGRSIGDADFRSKTGAMILAVKRSSNKVISNPSPSTVIKDGDMLVLFGTDDQLEEFNVLIK